MIDTVGNTVILLYFVVSISNLLVSAITESATQKVPENNGNYWSFGIGDIPSVTVEWLYDQVYAPDSIESPPRTHAENLDTSDKEKTANLVLDFDEFVDEPGSTKKVDDILKIIHDSSDEEKKQYTPFLENLEDRIINDPARYVKVFLKNMSYRVDLGIFKSGERRRNVNLLKIAKNVKGLLQTIRELLYEVLSSLFSVLTGKVKEGKRGVQKIWGTLERAKEWDFREYTEEEALNKLDELESRYKDMDKNTVIKDITSLSMQPLYKTSTYEKMLKFLEKLEKDGFEQNGLQKAFNYVNYKLHFSTREQRVH